MNRRTLLLLVGMALATWGIVHLATRSPPEDPASSGPVRAPAIAEPELQGREVADQAVPTEPSAHLESAEEGVIITGRVVDGRTLRGLAGVRVLALARGLESSPREAATDEEGAFRLPFGARPEVGVDVAIRAVASNGRGTSAILEIAPVGRDVEDVGTLFLRPTTTVLVRTVHEGKPVAGVSVFASSRPDRIRRRPGYRSDRAWPGFAYEAKSDDQGLARLEDVPRGAVRLLGLAEGPLRGERLLHTTKMESPVELVLVTARDLRVEVVWKDAGTPIPGCPVLLSDDHRRWDEPGAHPITDADGVALIRALPDDVPIRVWVVGPEWSSLFMRDVDKTVEPGVREIRVEIPTPHVLRFPIVAADGMHPEDGTRVSLIQTSWAHGPGTRIGLAREGVVEGGELVVGLYREFHERALARLPDGRVGPLAVVADWDPKTRRSQIRLPLEPVVFREPRSVRVEVVERPSGRPAEGVAVRGFFRKGHRRTEPVQTDPDGVALLSGLPALEGWVTVCANPSWVPLGRRGVFSQRIDVDLREKDAALRFAVEPIREGVLRITTEGHPGFPPGLHVDLWCLPEAVTWSAPTGLVFDAQRSEVRFRGRPLLAEAAPPTKMAHTGSAILLQLRSATHATDHVRIEAGQPWEASVDLQPAASLLVRVVKPEGMALDALLEAESEDGGWAPAWAAPVIPFPGEEEGDLYEKMKPGRYRLHDPKTGRSSPEVVARAGPEPTRLVWDLTDVDLAEGEVILPAGVDPKDLRVFVLEAEEPRIVTIARAHDGTRFRVPIPGDRPVKLTPVHRECIPDPERGSVTITRPEKGIRLHMIKRP